MAYAFVQDIAASWEQYQRVAAAPATGAHLASRRRPDRSPGHCEPFATVIAGRTTRLSLDALGRRTG
jgi:hypothetical protein